MAGLDFSDKVQEFSKDLKAPEQMLGKGLNIPMNTANSGARKLMFNVHSDHKLQLMHPEKAILETGYEMRFGDYSSSITKADTDYVVVAKISKFSFAPNHHYWLILKEVNSNKLDVVERISYHHITESYGYLYNNEFLDNLEVHSIVPNNSILQKSLSFDEYNNRRDGVNFNVCYLALDDNMEDSIIFSDAAAARFTAPSIKPVQIMINDNDIPLNIYGDDKCYKVIPDIGEDIVDANLIALRKEKKEEAYFTQSVDQLRRIMMSDTKKQTHGKVIDVNIYCNNPDILTSHYYEQLKMYYDETQRYNSEIVSTLLPYAAQGYDMSYDLKKLFANAKRVMNHDPYMDKRPFSNIILEIDVLEELKMHPGDKSSNRYGGKGVVSTLWPQKLMPRFKNALGEYEYVDVIFNQSTMVNRENVGQCFELSLTHIGCSIVNKIIADKIPLKEAYNMILTYVRFCSEQQAEYMEQRCSKMTDQELGFFIESILQSGAIQISMRPVTDMMTLDKLDAIYKAFPWITQNHVEVALADSDGNIRYIPARRPIVVGKEYMYRLKQVAEEKFSATSLSATNIRNENTKSRAKKDFRELYPNTPIRFGNMETNNMNHIGADAVIANMMIHSLSPQGRRLVEQMYTGDPFHIDIRLNSDSRNRSAEIANTYLKTIGRRLVFIKKKKHYERMHISPFYFDKSPVAKPISILPDSRRKGFDFQKDYEEMEKTAALKKEKGISPVSFDSRSRDPRKKNSFD